MIVNETIDKVIPIQNMTLKQKLIIFYYILQFYIYELNFLLKIPNILMIIIAKKVPHWSPSTFLDFKEWPGMPMIYSLYVIYLARTRVKLGWLFRKNYADRTKPLLTGDQPWARSAGTWLCAAADPGSVNTTLLSP